MTHCVQQRRFFGRGKRFETKRQRLLGKLANMRSAKERKRLANPPEPQPKLIRYFPLELGIRDKRTNEVAWVDLKSLRDAIRRLSVVLKFYT